jgi:hypothetical protein
VDLADAGLEDWTADCLTMRRSSTPSSDSRSVAIPDDIPMAELLT